MAVGSSLRNGTPVLIAALVALTAAEMAVGVRRLDDVAFAGRNSDLARGLARLTQTLKIALDGDELIVRQGV